MNNNLSNLGRSDYNLVKLERLDNDVAVISLDNGKVNSLSTELLRQLREVLESLSGDLPGAIVITGSDRMFAAGADIDELGALGGASDVAHVADSFRTTLDTLAAIPRVTVAAISGYALGGGCELALACDLRVAGETARLGLPEILLGIIPGGGGTQRLARLIGPARAKDLIFTGRHVPAGEALEIGLVDQVVPPGKVLDRAIEKASELALGAVAAQGLAKRAIDQGLDGTLSDGLDLEKELFMEVFDTEDSRTGILSFLSSGPGKAVFVGH